MTDTRHSRPQQPPAQHTTSHNRGSASKPGTAPTAAEVTLLGHAVLYRAPQAAITGEGALEGKQAGKLGHGGGSSREVKKPFGFFKDRVGRGVGGETVLKGTA